MLVLVDFDGTITDRDGFDLLARHHAGLERWERLDRAVRAGTISLREALTAQARYIRGSLDDASVMLEQNTVVDPSFALFADRCEERGDAICIVSSGIRQLIETSLSRGGIYGVQVYANAAVVRADGWDLVFRDESEHGHDKRTHVLQAHERGERVAFIGDGLSDIAAAEIADLRFAKFGSTLSDHLSRHGLVFTEFQTFADILSHDAFAARITSVKLSSKAPLTVSSQS